MEISQAELVLLAGVGMGIVKLLEYFLRWISKTFIKEGNDSKQNTTLALLRQDVDSILNNHLPHIEKYIQENKAELKIAGEERKHICITLARIEEKLSRV